MMTPGKLDVPGYGLSW